MKLELSTTVGKKIIVALTGLFMVFFVVVHLIGNLEIFAGPKAINDYAALLNGMPKVKWSFRILLLVAAIIHIWLTISLAKRNVEARPVRYHCKKSRKATLASRTMLISGLTILAFVIYHLAHYTIGVVDPPLLALTDETGRHHVYNMMVTGFSHPLVSGFYILAQILLAFHLSHGFASAFRTLGVNDHVLYQRLCVGSQIFAAIIAILYISIPASVLLGILPLL